MGNILAIDIGTSATKGVIFDPQGRVLFSVRCPYTILTPRPDWAEQDPDVVLQAVLETMREICREKPASVEIVQIYEVKNCQLGEQRQYACPMTPESRYIQPR